MGEVAPRGAVNEPDFPASGSIVQQEQAAGLWKIRRALTVASIAAAVGLVVVMMAVLAVLGFPRLEHKPLSTSQFLDVVKLVLGTVAGVGALFALVLAYRRQKLAEVAEIRDRGRAALEQQRARDDLTRVFNERFGVASAQLGHDGPAVRLAGAYAMAGLADDWEQGRQTCIDVLCAVLRLPYAPDPGENAVEAEDPAVHAVARGAYLAAREVRHTVIRIIGNHLNGHADVSWRGHDLDFTGVVFDGGDFQGAVFVASTVSFRAARFLGGVVTFEDAQFKDGTVTFEAAQFDDGTVTFHRARFEGGRIEFTRAGFKGGMVDFGNARFVGGTILFGAALFMGGTVTFRHAQFENSAVKFSGARFVNCAVSFDSAAGHRPAGLPDGMADHLSQ